MLQRLIKINLAKLVVCLIGVIHSIFLYNGFESTLRESEFFEQNEDLQKKEKIEGVVLYSLHFLLVFFLFYATFKNAVKFLLPWLLVAFLPLLYMTFMVLRDLQQMKWYLIGNLVWNFIYTGVCWLFWGILLIIFKHGNFKTTILIEQMPKVFSNLYMQNKIKDFY